MLAITFKMLVEHTRSTQVASEHYLSMLVALKEVAELAGSKNVDEQLDEDDLQTLRNLISDAKEMLEDLC